MSVTVSASSYPHLYKAFKEVAYDSGMVWSGEPMPTEIVVPDNWAYHQMHFSPGGWKKVLIVDIAERALSDLTHEGLSTFACGDQSEMFDMQSADLSLRYASSLLTGYFNSWQDKAGCMDTLRKDFVRDREAFAALSPEEQAERQSAAAARRIEQVAA